MKIKNLSDTPIYVKLHDPKEKVAATVNDTKIEPEGARGMPNKWEIVHHDGANETTDRMQIRGGWLYRTRVRDNYRNESVDLTFVPESNRPSALSDVAGALKREIIRAGFVDYEALAVIAIEAFREPGGSLNASSEPVQPSPA